ncbi:AIPR family protein [Clostridium bowmanii]|uniref:AIPR family protein n=1 Tax=Clostridium bowmanii TaxID=132925 RepID=UPI001C0DECB1|nr:AIPR family protein [Clostridium bowmanii]MBU3188331.1 AIPR family protein [Clostridium bowmanii]MCA1072719.1 AIPR family protein [Clostridium bowmanii]
MKSNISLLEFASNFYQEVLLAKETDAYSLEFEDFFTAVMLEYLEEIGEVENAVICPYRVLGLQMNGYSISEEFDSVDIYVSIFDENENPQRITRTEIDASLKRAIQLYRKAINDLYASFEKDSDTYGFASAIHKHKNDIKNVRVIALTNGLVKPISFKDILIEGANVSFLIWDIERLYRCVNSGKMREMVEIDFVEKFNTAIECIENKTSDKYIVYLAIVPGKILAQLYEEHGARLLERNVRSFLQVKGPVNKGIRETLRDEPDMFLAYNNGISVTAESVEVERDENGKPSITKIKDMQIVNGGQTTASIFSAYKDKKIQSEISNVYVQMKLSVINVYDEMNKIIPNISAFANTQNKVQIADFSANDPFHRKVEELSRICWAPAKGGLKPKNWFYERARGQYSDMLSRESTLLRKKQYKEEHPLFTKTDLSKYENTWDQLPYQVSEGAQKNFKKFTLRLKERGNVMPNSKYYEHLISKTILFRQTERLVQGQKYGGYRANIVAYTIAFASYKTSQRIDLDCIWKEQCLSTALENEIINISKLAQRHIVNPPGGANIGEWCKNVKCWNEFKEIDYTISDELAKELISVLRPNTAETQNKSINSVTEDEISLIQEVNQIPAETWFSLSRWAKETNNFQTWQRSLAFSIGTILGRNKVPTYKQANQAIKVYMEAKTKGFK